MSVATFAAICQMPERIADSEFMGPILQSQATKPSRKQSPSLWPLYP